MKLRHCMLSLIPVVVLFSMQAHAGCWELTDRHDKRTLVIDIWHVKSRLGGGGVLIGRLNGEDASIAVDDINSVTLQPGKAGLLSFTGKGGSQGEIAFTNGSRGQFSSDLNLMYRTAEEKGSLPLANIRSITRCDSAAEKTLATSTRTAAKDTPTPGQHAVERDVDAVYLSNGDILTGTITLDEIRWQSPYATLVFSRDQVLALTLQRDDAPTGLAELRSGDRISGTLLNTSVDITLGYGQRVPLAADRIRAIRFRETAP